MMRQLTCADTGLPVIANTLARTVPDRDRSVVRLLEKYALASGTFSVINDRASGRDLSLPKAPSIDTTRIQTRSPTPPTNGKHDP